jgi:hypothetical protein
VNNADDQLLSRFRAIPLQGPSPAIERLILQTAARQALWRGNLRMVVGVAAGIAVAAVITVITRHPAQSLRPLASIQEPPAGWLDGRSEGLADSDPLATRSNEAGMPGPTDEPGTARQRGDD